MSIPAQTIRTVLMVEKYEHEKKGTAMKTIIRATLIASFSLLLWSCTNTRSYSPGSMEPRTAIARIVPTTGNTANGLVRFEQLNGKVKITAEIKGLKPNSLHGFHIHEYGDFSAMDATSAGDHYNPENLPHAGPLVSRRHAGDLGNISADANGEAHYELTVGNISISGRNAILGRGLVVHADPDDLVSQPTGNAGARIGYGTIGVAKPVEPQNQSH